MDAQPRQNLFHRFVDWLYAPGPLSPKIIRLTGAVLLYTWWIQLIKMPPRPYHVPSWRLGEHLFALPDFPLSVEFTLWGIFYIGALLMTLGANKKWFIAVMGAVFIYHGSREVQIFHMNYQLLLATFFIAFLFNRQNGPSCSRRLIQLSIGACYFYGAFGKLHPEWLNGQTLNNLLYNGWDIRETWQPLFKLAPLPMPILGGLSYVLFAIEMYLAFAFFFERTRKSALIIGILLHAAFALFIQQVEGYSAIMLIGYMTFFQQGGLKPAASSTETEATDAQKDSANSAIGKKANAPFFEKACAVFFALALMLMPARYYLFPKYSLTRETLFDHSPWGFGMYLFQQNVKDVKVELTLMNGSSFSPPMSERMKECSSDTEFLCLAQYLFRKYPEAESIRITSSILINKKRELQKTGFFKRNSASEITVH